jgi:AcrR family transcriptional regulator
MFNTEFLRLWKDRQMRRSKADTARTRERIVETASEQFRRHGISDAGLSRLMAAAGLTHGGFYRHFASKDQLVSEACHKALLSLSRMASQLALLESLATRPCRFCSKSICLETTGISQGISRPPEVCSPPGQRACSLRCGHEWSPASGRIDCPPTRNLAAG